MSLTLDDVRRVADLARLDLPSGADAALLAQLNRFFDLAQQLRAVDTRDTQPLYTPLAALGEVPLRLREDVVTAPVGEAGRAANQASAPAVEAGLYLVPRVIE